MSDLYIGSEFFTTDEWLKYLTFLYETGKVPYDSDFEVLPIEFCSIELILEFQEYEEIDIISKVIEYLKDAKLEDYTEDYSENEEE